MNNGLHDQLRVSKEEQDNQRGSTHGVEVAMDDVMSMEMRNGRGDLDHLHRIKIRDALESRVLRRNSTIGAVTRRGTLLRMPVLLRLGRDKLTGEKGVIYLWSKARGVAACCRRRVSSI
jgi:hypothetical protein